MAKKKVEIDWHGTVSKLLVSGSSGREVAAFIGIAEETLYRRCLRDLKKDFSVFKQEQKAKGDSALRSNLFNRAMSGNTAIAIFLAKNRLGMADKIEQKTEHTGEVGNVNLIIQGVGGNDGTGE